MSKIKGKIALVTGASSGVGEATAQRLAAAGYKVYGTSRRGAQAGKRSFEMLPLDVTSDEPVEAVVSEVSGATAASTCLRTTRASVLHLPERKRVRSIRPDRSSKRIDKVFPFEQAKEALAYLEQGRAKGKVVVKVR